MASNVAPVKHLCTHMAINMMNGIDTSEITATLASAAADYAREGISLESIQHALHEGFKVGFDVILGQGTPSEPDPIRALPQRLLDLLDTAYAAISTAYIEELRGAIVEHRTATHTLTSALLAGCAPAALACSTDIDLAESYHVVALAISRDHVAHEPTHIVVQRVEHALTLLYGRQTPSMLSADGGTVLVPVTTTANADLEGLIPFVSKHGRVRLTAAAVDAAIADIPTAADQARELLDTVLRLGAQPGLYQVKDVAVEHQLARPGPAREHLAALLDPLDTHPDLLDTLERHIANGLRRMKTANELHVHPNTVDYRLRRIKQLTGFDPAEAAGMWQLRSAMLARRI